jgi:hypothetical protein
MPATQSRERDALQKRRNGKRARDAAALTNRLGPDGVAWLDGFLADYVFEGEPLDRVLTEARRLAELPPRREPHGFGDD